MTDEEVAKAKKNQNYQVEKICDNCIHKELTYLPIPGRIGFPMTTCSIGGFHINERSTCDLFTSE